MKSKSLHILLKDAILAEPISHHRRKLERPVERQNFMERDYSHHNEEEQELLHGLETTSPERDFMSDRYVHKKHHHRHPFKFSQNTAIEEDLSDTRRTGFQHHQHHHKHLEPSDDANNFGEDDEPTMVR